MSQHPAAPPSSGDDLSFTHAQAADGPAPSDAPGAVRCVACGQPIVETYFAAGEKVVCPGCRERYVAAMTGGSGAARLMKAGAFGVGAGIVGGAIWYGIRVATDADWGIIAVGVGLLVGAAVRAGAERRGGIGYQLLAVVLTYLTIAANYIPYLVAEIQNDPESTSAPLVFVVLFAAAFSIVAPVLVGMESPILLLIYAFALWEAWKMNTRQVVELQGPYTLSKPAPTSTGPVA